MEKLTRVKKYEDLRKSIETDNNIDAAVVEEENGKQTDDLLKSFDSSIFKKVDITEDETAPKRAKELDETVVEKKDDVNDTFTNEYLDDFMKEVRDYNIRKGNRESEDTEVDILYQLNAANRAKRTHYIQEIQEEEQVQPEGAKTVLSKEEIAREVQNLLKEETVEEVLPEEPMIPQTQSETEVIPTPVAPVDAAVEQEEPVQLLKDTMVKKVVTPVYEELVEEDETAQEEAVEVDGKNTYHKKLIEETQQLRVQMDEYEEELTDLSDGVEKTNKLLNFVLCFLILVLLVVIGFIAYSIWKAGGFDL